jgi:hypothetical protein
LRIWKSGSRCSGFDVNCFVLAFVFVFRLWLNSARRLPLRQPSQSTFDRRLCRCHQRGQ